MCKEPSYISLSAKTTSFWIFKSLCNLKTSSTRQPTIAKQKTKVNLYNNNLRSKKHESKWYSRREKRDPQPRPATHKMQQKIPSQERDQKGISLRTELRLTQSTSTGCWSRFIQRRASPKDQWALWTALSMICSKKSAERHPSLSDTTRSKLCHLERSRRPFAFSCLVNWPSTPWVKALKLSPNTPVTEHNMCLRSDDVLFYF